MKHLLLSVALVLLPFNAQAEAPEQIIADIVDHHILAGFERLDLRAGVLEQAAQAECDPTSAGLRTAYADAFDAWTSVSHLRFGPTEVHDRAFALAFWPDARGATPRALGALISQRDPVGRVAESYAKVSIAARGFYAMEFLLYNEATRSDADPSYFCALVQTVAADIAANSSAILTDWQNDYAARLLAPATDDSYRSTGEVLQELFKALTTGLQFTSDTRLGRPLGTFERPRPKRAESWRSGRSARHVMLSLTALEDLALRLSANDPDVRIRIGERFEDTLAKLDALDDPAFSGVADPQSRLKIEAVQQSVDAIRATVRDELGPTLGVAAGFNALDGD